MLNRTISVAPMMDWTDRHDRYFLRQISQSALLYTEMVTTGAILFGDADRHLKFDPAEHPVAIQLGGSEPDKLAKCALICAEKGYDEINLNVGCPSDRVQAGKIGACLMAEPELVADCYKAMADVVDIPVTIKHRIGIDDLDSYAFVCDFVGKLADAGCKTFIVHARKAILSGLSPKQNREIPPLNYETVYRLKQDFAGAELILNGGVRSLAEAQSHLAKLDGVMIGREAYHNPYILAEVDRLFYDSEQPVVERQQIVQSMLAYIQKELSQGARLQHISRHMLGLYHGQPNGKLWRRHLSEKAYKAEASIDVIESAMALVD